MAQDRHYKKFKSMILVNRDLSWLSFNLRVLEEAHDPAVPLFERMKFLAIFSSNLNEFFRVRYPEVIALSVLNKKTKKAIENFEENIADKVQDEIKFQLNFFGEILHEEILPELKNNGIIFYYGMPIRKEHLPEIREIFLSDALSFIQPIYLEPDAPKNFIPKNNQLYFLITLQDDEEGILKHAIVNIPSGKVKRFYTLSRLDNFEYVIFLDDIVRENLQYLFPNQKITSVYSIKINRDAELHLADDYSGNLLQKIEKQLKKRDFNPPSRFLYEDGMPRNLQMFLASVFNVNSDEIFAGGRYHNLSDLEDFPSFNKNLYYQKRKPLSSSNILNSGDIFDILLKEDILLHLPYQSYNPVLSFFNQAAVDVNVTEIYITLYRVAEESHIINALISAAKNGKDVVVFIELKARFDEANNIKWSKVMKDAGVHIIYSLPKIKVHSKIALVKKKKEGEKEAFAVLSTGNFNEVTAQFYTDHVLMTSDEKITKELMQLFKFLELSHVIDHDKKIKFECLLVSQFNMVSSLEKLINKEIQKAKDGEPALIRIKVNNLEEPHFIGQLYKAGKAGVKIELIVRSICCLVPGIPGESDNITVKRIVGRYLEHSRVLIFGAGDDVEVLMGSADLMTRNLYHRIEVFVRVKDEECKKELINYFDIQWKNDDQDFHLLSDGVIQKKIDYTDNIKHNVQLSVYNFLSEIK
jgi:polyphosphate kinase